MFNQILFCFGLTPSNCCNFYREGENKVDCGHNDSAEVVNEHLRAKCIWSSGSVAEWGDDSLRQNWAVLGRIWKETEANFFVLLGVCERVKEVEWVCVADFMVVVVKIRGKDCYEVIANGTSEQLNIWNFHWRESILSSARKLDAITASRGYFTLVIDTKVLC